jgi:hypothetical protein
MKTIRLKPLIVISCLVLTIFSCKQRLTGYQSECNSLNTDGYIILNICESKSSKTFNTDKASKMALHAVLYSGVAGTKSCSTQPPMLNTEKEVSNFKNIEKKFFSKHGEWSRFTRSSLYEENSSDNSKLSNPKKFQVYVSKNELRKYLEENKIISKLNKGF